MYSTYCYSVGTDSQRHVTEVTYDIGNSGSYSDYTVLTVTVSVGSDSHRHVTEVTYDIGNSGSYSECTVHADTVSVGSDSQRHVTEVRFAPNYGTSPFPAQCSNVFAQVHGIFCSLCRVNRIDHPPKIGCHAPCRQTGPMHLQQAPYLVH
jgi:hypothetical protein